MNENEAIERIKYRMHTAGQVAGKGGMEDLEMAIKALEDVQQYRAIGTPEECRAAVEKQRAKRIIHEPNAGRERDWRCPNCDSYINPYAKYCIGCGQKLKGGGVDE